MNQTAEQAAPKRMFRCPYCKRKIGGEPQTLCPHCNKTMMVPDSLAERTVRDRKRAKERIHRQIERKKAGLRIPDASFGRKPSFVLLAALTLAMVGALLVNRTRQVYAPQTDDARIGRAAHNLETLRIALERFSKDCGRYPTEVEGLHSLLRDHGIEGWRGPYVNMVRPDPWGRAFRYAVTNDTVTLFSTGPDGVPGTEADIFSMPVSAEPEDGETGPVPSEGDVWRREVVVPVRIGRGPPPTRPAADAIIPE